MKELLQAFARMPLALLAIVGLLLGGSACSSNKAGIAAPELPARHWLDEAPGIPIESKEKYDQAVPSLYEPNKKFTFEDCVYLTIQQSPSLVNSAVNIEIKRLAQTDATWKYLPEPHMTLTVSQNLTNFNRGAPDTSGEYGRPQFEISFYAPFPNPVATYFEQKAQGMMTGIAISTHRKAVGEAIFKIAEAYLRLQAHQYSLAAQRSLLPVARELTEYWRHLEHIEGSQGSSVSLSQQSEREAELGLEKAIQQETMQRTTLKILAGVNPEQKFNVDASQADTHILHGFNGKKLRWEDCWNESEDNLLLRTQIKLADYNIMLAWAQYVPNMSFSVNMNPPRGQSQPESGTADQFLHFSFDFPLIDWGRRYRGVQTARMGKAQAFHALAEKRFDFQNRWLQAEQEVDLAFTNLKLAQNRYKTAQMQYEESRISFENGLNDLPDVAEKQEKMVNAQIDYINTELEFRLANLKWMFVSGRLQKHFLGLPDSELSKDVGLAGLVAKPLIDEDLREDADAPVFQEPKTPTRTIGRVEPVKIDEIPSSTLPSLKQEPKAGNKQTSPTKPQADAKQAKPQHTAAQPAEPQLNTKPTL